MREILFGYGDYLTVTVLFYDLIFVRFIYDVGSVCFRIQHRTIAYEFNELLKIF